jgi:cytochrome b561
VQLLWIIQIVLFNLECFLFNSEIAFPLKSLVKEVGIVLVIEILYRLLLKVAEKVGE